VWGAIVIEQLRQQFQREAAAQAEAEAAREEARQAKRRSRRDGPLGVLYALSPKALINLPRFTLIMTIWGAALLGLSVIALSSVDIARVSMVLGLGALGQFAKFVYAAIAAAIGAAGAFVVAHLLVRFFGRSGRRGPVAMLAADRVRPIDREELGSDSLDTPIEEIPFSALPEADDAHEADEADEDSADGEEPEERDLEETALLTFDAEPAEETSEEDVFELDALIELDEPIEDDPIDSDQSSDENSDAQDDAVAKSVAPGLNIDAFRDILAEETIKAEALEQEARELEAASAQISAIAPNPTSGIEKLRQLPTQDLSLIQLVERFAAALHDAQDRSAQEFTGAQLAEENASRERALAQALKALELFTDRGFDQGGAGDNDGTMGGTDTTISETERDLQEALTKLQSLRGAA